MDTKANNHAEQIENLVRALRERQEEIGRLNCRVGQLEAALCEVGMGREPSQAIASAEPVAEVRDGGLSGPAIAPLVCWENLPDGTKLYTRPATQAASQPVLTVITGYECARLDTGSCGCTAYCSGYFKRQARQAHDMLQPPHFDMARAQAVAAEPAGQPATKVEVDAARYNRLRILGAAPYGSKQLESGNVLCFQSLDAFVDADRAARPSRGEARPVSQPVAAVDLSERQFTYYFSHRSGTANDWTQISRVEFSQCARANEGSPGLYRLLEIPVARTPAPASDSAADKIERFSIYEDHGRANMMGDDDGDYVLYSHHVEALADRAARQVPAAPATLTNEQIREILHKHSRYMGQPDYYSDTEFACLQDVIGFARAIESAIAAHPGDKA